MTTERVARTEINTSTRNKRVTYTVIIRIFDRTVGALCILRVYHMRRTRVQCPRNMCPTDVQTLFPEPVGAASAPVVTEFVRLARISVFF